MVESLRLDARYPGVGRIAKASGVFDARSLTLMKAEFKELARTALGRDLLKAVRDGALTCLQVYDAARRRSLHELPDAAGLDDAATAWEAWLVDADAEYATWTLLGYRDAWKSLVRYTGRSRFPVNELPAMLARARKQTSARRRSFNLLRAATLSFLRQRAGKHSPLYAAALAVEPRRYKRDLAIELEEPLSPAELKVIIAQIAHPERAAMAWTMACTGMLPTEYWGRWESELHATVIYGEKRAGRMRRVPRVVQPARPACSLQTFRRDWRAAVAAAREKEKLEPGTAPGLLETRTRITLRYLRRCYARWMELAGIPRARRRMYLGHGARDITDLYEAHDIRRFLSDDAESFRKYLIEGSTVRSTVPRLVEGGGEGKVVAVIGLARSPP